MKVVLVPVTEEQSVLLNEAAQTLTWLYRITGRAEHKEQSDLVFHFSGGKYGGRMFGYAQTFEMPVTDDVEVEESASQT